jgi:hypothetical protein
MTKKMKCCQYGPIGRIQNTSFSLYLTNGPNKLVGVPSKPLQPSVMQHFRLLGPFVSDEENKVL